jgi:hypothetical protein
MKRLALFLFCSVPMFAQGAGVHSVYVLPMAGGLDQYLAERLARDHVMQVTADPKTADSVLTDHLGEGFEQQLDKLTGKNERDKDIRPSFHSSAAKGTIFLVDTKSRRVLWSDYEKPSRGGMDREAERVSKKLQSFGK